MKEDTKIAGTLMHDGRHLGHAVSKLLNSDRHLAPTIRLRKTGLMPQLPGLRRSRAPSHTSVLTDTMKSSTI